MVEFNFDAKKIFNAILGPNMQANGYNNNISSGNPMDAFANFGNIFGNGTCYSTDNQQQNRAEMTSEGFKENTLSRQLGTLQDEHFMKASLMYQETPNTLRNADSILTDAKKYGIKNDFTAQDYENLITSAPKYAPTAEELKSFNSELLKKKDSLDELGGIRESVEKHVLTEATSKMSKSADFDPETLKYASMSELKALVDAGDSADSSDLIGRLNFRKNTDFKNMFS